MKSAGSKGVGFGAIALAAGLGLAATPAAAQWKGFYLSFAAGGNHVEGADVDVSLGGGLDANVKAKAKLGVGLSAAFGFNFGGPRVELEVAYRRNKLDSDLGGEKLESATAMANAIYEVFSDSRISPYIGVGLGAGNAWVEGDSDGFFAVQAILGLNVKITPSVSLTADYRYMRALNDLKLSLIGGVARHRYANHGAFIGLTYRFGVQPATASRALPPASAVATAAMVPTPRQYIVYFGFDRAELTPAAVSTVRQAGAEALRGTTQLLEVTGHADRAGSERYNMALSLRRADAVRTLLIAEGVPSEQILVVARGETYPAIQTADGVADPRNRRVVIILR